MNKELTKIWALLESVRNENNKEIIDILQSDLDEYDKKNKKEEILIDKMDTCNY